MSIKGRVLTVVFGTLAPITLLGVIIYLADSAPVLAAFRPELLAISGSEGSSEPATGDLQEAQLASLDISIISSPWATLDSNDPGGSSEIVPNVFVVEAVVTNTGTTATDLVVTLDYNEDPGNNWILVPGENPVRTINSLANGEAYYAYWFAQYSTTISATHVYTVSASAANAGTVATSDNYYGNPVPGKTVQTRSTLSTGNSGLSNTSADIVVGVLFTVTSQYDLGTNPVEASFSPVGNDDFVPSAYRLLASKVKFYNDAATQEATYQDQLYFPSLDAFADNAEATYTFIALTPSETRLCSYAAVGFSQNAKYDQQYCEEAEGTVTHISGTLDLSMTKQVSAAAAQQGEALTYTIDYSNTGDLPLSFVWIWDPVDTGIGSILTPTIDPPGDPGETSADQVAWSLPAITESGQPGSTGTLTFTLLVDGNGLDLADGTSLVNNSFFGINPGSLPQSTALTSTVVTTIQAPTIEISKTDGQTTAEPGEELVYTLSITNSGSVAAAGVVVTDVLPADVVYVSGTAGETSRNGQTLVWDNLGPIAAGGGMETIAITVTVGSQVPNGTVLSNNATVKYENTAGHIYATESANDTTVVNAPVLSISKSDFPDPVLTGRSLTYTLSYTNSGPAPATSVVITDVVPISTTYQTCSGGQSCGPIMGGTAVSWTIGLVPASTNGTANFVVLVDEDMQTGDLVTNNQYGIVADQTGVVAGSPVTTTVSRDAAIIDGYAFRDDNGNGVRDGGESGLAAITVTLPSATVPMTATDSTGYYYFTVEMQEPISVTAALPTGYFRTTPGTVNANSIFGITQTIDFGYAPVTSTFGVVFGSVFEDADGSGDWEIGEVGLEGVTVTLDAGQTTNTDLYGSYTFPVNSEGIHSVVETDPPDYFSTTPNDVHVDVQFGASYLVNFGDAPAGSGFGAIFGTVFEDANGNGLLDGNEIGIEGVTVTMDGSETTVTDAFGNYGFATATPGVHTVVETDPPNYFSTTSNEVHVLVSIGSGNRVDFGDAPDGSGFAAIYGVVFRDSNQNAQWDVDEVGIEGVTVTLDASDTTTTSLYGTFTFSTTVTGMHTAVETDPPNHISTTPNTVTVDVVLDMGYEVRYGDVPICTPDSFEEDDTSTQAAELTLDAVQAHNFCDDAVDWQKFTARNNSVYTVTTSAWGQRTDTFLTLYDTDAQTVLAANDDAEGSTDFSSQIVWEAPADGVFYIRATNRGGLTEVDTEYDLWMEVEALNTIFLPIIPKSVQGSGGKSGQLSRLAQEVSASDSEAGNNDSMLGEINHACPDAHEIDDTWGIAPPILDGDVGVHSFDSDPNFYANDKDYVSFDLLPGGTVTFTISTVTNTSTLMELYDSHGAALNMTGTTQLVFREAQMGRYYLSVSPLSTTFGCSNEVGYVLEANFAERETLFLPIIRN